MRKTPDTDELTVARLAVIDEKLETIIAELAVIRKFIPCTIVEHTERIDVLSRGIKAIHWLGGVLAVALTGAFIGHVLGR